MYRRISDDIIARIEEMYAGGRGLNFSQISGETGVSRHMVSFYAKYRHETNPDTGEPFKSPGEWMTFKTKKMVNPDTNMPFASRSKYEEYRRNKSGLPRRQYDPTKSTNPETKEPFRSRYEYKKYRHSVRKNSPENVRFRSLLSARLGEMGETQSWLASKMGCPQQTVSTWTRGVSIPEGGRLERLFGIVDLPYKTLDDFLNDRDRLKSLGFADEPRA